MDSLDKEIRKRRLVFWMVGGSLLLILTSALSRATGGPVGDGQSTFKAKCVMCHGADGSGNTPMGKKMKLRDLRSPEVQKQSDAQLSEVIVKGKSPMPGYEKQLGKEKIRDVVAYLRELGKKH